MTVLLVGSADFLQARALGKRGLLASLLVTGLTTAVAAQRFDNWVAAPNLPGVAMTNMVTHPVTGAPTMLVSVLGGGTDTVAWDGTAFVSLGLANNPGLFQAEYLAPFVSPTAAGMVHLDGNGITSIWTGGPAWTTLGVLVPSPSGRGLAAATTAVGASGEAFLFGGTGPAFFNDLWSWNGTAWTNLTPTTGPLPSARHGAAMSVDGGGGLLIYGGTDGANIWNDVWMFDGLQWELRGKGPSERTYHAMVLDISRGQIVTFGGVDGAGQLSDAWALSAPGTASDATIGAWVPVGSLPFTSASGLVTGALDAVRHELVGADLANVGVVNDRIASFLVRAQSPFVACVVPNLQIIQSMVTPFEPRIGTTLPMGGLTGVAGAPMILLAEIVGPGLGVSPATLIPATSCFSFLSPAALTIAGTFTSPGGSYQFNLPLPPTPTLVGVVIDEQAFGLAGAMIMASQAVRIVIGR